MAKIVCTHSKLKSGNTWGIGYEGYSNITSFKCKTCGKSHIVNGNILDNKDRIKRVLKEHFSEPTIITNPDFKIID